MPYIFRRGYVRAARESSYGTPSTTAFPGALYGPLSPMFSVPSLWGPGAGTASIPTIGLPFTTKDITGVYDKHVSPMIVGRRFEDVMQVPGRRHIEGSFNVPVTPNALGFWLLNTLGVDSVAPIETNVISADVAANDTTFTVATLANNLTVGQRLFFRHTNSSSTTGANAEYVSVGVAATAGSSVTVTITGGAGTGGGFKFAHSSAAQGKLDVGPWTHTFTPTNAATGYPTFQIEDNWGGAPSSPFYTGLVVDSMDFNFQFDNNTAALEAVCKVYGTASNPTGAQTASTNTFASPNQGGAFTLPVEEVPVVVGNLSTLSQSNTANVDATNKNPVTSGGSATKVYLPSFKAQIMQNAKMIQTQNSSPDPYAILPTNFSFKGSMDTIFEDYGVYFDYARNQIWENVALTTTWGAQVLQSTAGATSPTLTFNVFNMAIEKAGKQTNKDNVVAMSVDAWRALDNGPNTAKNFTTVMSVVLVNDVAVY